MDDVLAVSPEQAAGMLSVSRAHVYNLMAAGEIAWFKIGRCRRIPVAAIEALMSKGLVSP